MKSSISKGRTARCTHSLFSRLSVGSSRSADRIQEKHNSSRWPEVRGAVRAALQRQKDLWSGLMSVYWRTYLPVWPIAIAREFLLHSAPGSHGRHVFPRCLARDLRRTGALGLSPAGIRLSKSKVISRACGMLNSSMRSKSIEPAARSIFPIS